MWKTILISLGIIVVLVVVFFSGQISQGFHKVTGYYSRMFHQAVDEKLQEAFQKTADKYNKRGPVMVNDNLRLDKTVAGPGARIAYFYTFTRYSSHDIKRDTLYANLSTKLVKGVCENEKIKPSLELGAEFDYVYSGNDGVELTRVAVNKKACGY